MKIKISLVVALVFISLLFIYEKRNRSHQEINSEVKSPAAGEVSIFHSSTSRDRSNHQPSKKNLEFSSLNNFFIPNHTTLQTELDKLKKIPERISFDLETYPNNMNSVMLFYKQRIDNGTDEDKRESIAIFELAASEHLDPEIIDNHIKYNSLEELSKNYPEYAEQIHHAYEIRQYYDKLYLTYLKGSHGAEFIKDENQLGKADFSFLHSMLSYYKNYQNKNINEEAMINTLNYFTGGQFGDKNLQWWLSDFERDPNAEFFNNSERATWLKK